MSEALAFAAGSLAAIAAAQAAAALAARVPGLVAAAGGLVDAFLRVGREGREPGALERRRLLAAGAGVALVVGTAAAGPAVGLAAAGAGPWAVARALRTRRERYHRAVERGAPALALALADALTGGHSLRGAIVEAADGLPGPAGGELRRVRDELALGARTDDALESMRARAGSRAVGTIVAAALLQRRAGGDLARLLRDTARALEDQERLDGEVRAATAQARFTGVLVALLPLGGAALAELASPGYLAGLAGSFLTAWLVGIALAMQGVAAVMIRRLGRVRA